MAVLQNTNLTNLSADPYSLTWAAGACTTLRVVVPISKADGSANVPVLFRIPNLHGADYVNLRPSSVPYDFRVGTKGIVSGAPKAYVASGAAEIDWMPIASIAEPTS